MVENSATIQITSQGGKVRGIGRKHDATLGWALREYPQLAVWHSLAVEWMKGETKGVHHRLHALTAFLERYVIQQGLPFDPSVLLSRKTVLPDFYHTACPDSESGVRLNNVIHSFLHFVLLREFSELDVQNKRVISSDFHNPVPRRTEGSGRRRDESVYSPLPFGYIDELRQILAPGPNFRDWHWAQTSLGVEIGRRGALGPESEVSPQIYPRSWAC
ncbi:MAG: VPA1269 family protein [Pyrinomonadaceae bacterium]